MERLDVKVGDLVRNRLTGRVFQVLGEYFHSQSGAVNLRCLEDGWRDIYQLRPSRWELYKNPQREIEWV